MAAPTAMPTMAPFVSGCVLPGLAVTPEPNDSKGPFVAVGLLVGVEADVEIEIVVDVLREEEAVLEVSDEVELDDVLESDVELVWVEVVVELKDVGDGIVD